MFKLTCFSFPTPDPCATNLAEVESKNRCCVTAVPSFIHQNLGQLGKINGPFWNLQHAVQPRTGRKTIVAWGLQMLWIKHQFRKIILAVVAFFVERPSPQLLLEKVSIVMRDRSCLKSGPTHSDSFQLSNTVSYGSHLLRRIPERSVPDMYNARCLPAASALMQRWCRIGCTNLSGKLNVRTMLTNVKNQSKCWWKTTLLVHFATFFLNVQFRVVGFKCCQETQFYMF